MDENRIPGNIVRKLGVDAKRSNMEVIIDFLTQERGTVELNKTQQELYDRWDFADNMIRKRQYKKTEITKALMQKFEIGISTARADLADAEFVFGSTRKFSKIYHLSNHIDQIEDLIVQALREGDKDIMIKLLYLRMKSIAMMPDEMKKELHPTKLIFNLTQNNTVNELYVPNQFTEEDAKKLAASKLHKLGIDLELLDLTQYLEVEDVTE